MIRFPWFVSRRSISKATARRRFLVCESLEQRQLLASASFHDAINAVAVDRDGNQYVNYSSIRGTVDIDPDPSRTYYVKGTGGEYGNEFGRVLVKYSPTNEVLWAKTDADLPRGGNDLQLATGPDGNEYLYSFRAAVSKLDLNGNLLWTTTSSGGGIQDGFVDSDGSIYGSGTFRNSVDLDVGKGNLGPDVTAPLDKQSMFVAKWDINGDLQWAHVIGSSETVWAGNSTADATAIAVADGHLFVGGMFWGSLTIDTQPTGFTDQSVAGGGTPDGFIAVFDASGNLESCSHFIDAKPGAIRAVGSDVYLAAQFGYTTDLDPGPGQFLLTPENINGENLAVARLQYNPSVPGAFTVQWAEKFSSGTGASLAGGMVLSGTDLYLSGQFGATTDFDPSSATYALTALGTQDVFVAKLAADTGGLVWVSQLGAVNRYPVGPGQENADLTITSTGILVGGYVATGPVSFRGPNQTTISMGTAGFDQDAFVATLDLNGGYQSSFIVGGVTRTIDNSDAGYSETGSGWKNINIGYNSSARGHAKGKGTNFANWTFTNLPAGTYQVMTRFPLATSNQATNAPFTVNGTPVSVNQRVSPNDFLTVVDGGWESLGTAVVSNGTLKVTLSDKADAGVVADVVRIWLIEPAAPAAAQPGMDYNTLDVLLAIEGWETDKD